jgi:serine/threonine-protein kinase
VPKGEVIKTDPSGGSKAPKGSTVRVFVSSGLGSVAVPSVVGLGISDATSALQAKGFQVVTRTAVNSTAAANTVVRQRPAANTKAPHGSTVTIFISGGVVPVPSVIGDPKATAIQILQGDGFKVNAITVAGPAGSTPGNVFNQNPPSGTSLPPGKTVTIYVAAAASPSPTPTSPTPTPTTTSPTPTPTPT